MREQLPSFIRHLHYRTEADALAIVVDADYSVIHAPSHSATGSVPDCRRCELTTVVSAVSKELAPVPGRARLRFAVGVAVPAIEAWLLAGKHRLASEASWAQARGDERFSHVKGALKVAAFGGLHVAESIRRPTAQRLIREALGEGDLLRTYFPSGFGAFADDILAW